MFVKRVLIVPFLICTAVLSLKAQGEIDEQQRVMFRDESSFGGFLNSNGFGVNYRYGFWRNARNQFILDGDLAYVKHPKEVKVQAYYSYNTRRYVFGKKNLFWELKGMAGWQRELYRKHDRTGIAVRMFYSGGLSLGFLKPIYYQVYTFSDIGEAESYEYMKFDLSIHQTNIGGRGPFFKGFDELSLIPGLTAKAGMSFEYSERDIIIHALEAGVGITAYPRQVPIMATENNNFLFFNLYVGYRFGTVIDISEAARARSWRERREERREERSNLPLQPLY
jgi:hypothetical protein